jgi:hypothetical protein
MERGGVKSGVKALLARVECTSCVWRWTVDGTPNDRPALADARRRAAAHCRETGHRVVASYTDVVEYRHG